MSNLPPPLETRPAIAREAFRLLQHLTSDWLRSRALRGLLPLLPLDLYPEAVAMAHTLLEPGARARALLGLAGIAPNEQRPTLALEAVKAVHRLPSETDRVWVLSGALNYLADEDRSWVGDEAFAACQHIAAPLDRLRSLSQLPPDYFAKTFEEARSTTDAYARAEGLSVLAHSAPEAQRAEVVIAALAAARSLSDPALRARALISVARARPDTDQPAIVAEAWAAAQTSDLDEAGGFLLSYFAGGLPEAAIPEALTFARQLPEPQRRAATLISILPRLPHSQQATLLPEILAVIQKIGDEWARGVALSQLAHNGPPHVRDELVRLVGEISDGWAKASTLSDIAETLSAEAKTEALRAALISARSATSPWARVRALTDVAEQLPG